MLSMNDPDIPQIILALLMITAFVTVGRILYMRHFKINTLESEEKDKVEQD